MGTLNQLDLASSLASGGSKDLYTFLINMQTRMETLEALVNTNVSVLAAAVHNIPTDHEETSVDPYDLASSIVTFNSVKAKYNTHRISVLEHDAADATNVVTASDATDLATAITLANQIKAKHNAHCGNATAHDAADTANTVAAADASDLATLLVLGASVRAAWNNHVDETNAKGVIPSASIRSAVMV